MVSASIPLPHSPGGPLSPGSPLSPRSPATPGAPTSPSRPGRPGIPPGGPIGPAERREHSDGDPTQTNPFPTPQVPWEWTCTTSQPKGPKELPPSLNHIGPSRGLPYHTWGPRVSFDAIPPISSRQPMGPGSSWDAGASNTNIVHIAHDVRDRQRDEDEGQREQQHGLLSGSFFCLRIGQGSMDFFFWAQTRMLQRPRLPRDITSIIRRLSTACCLVPLAQGTGQSDP